MADFVVSGPHELITKKYPNGAVKVDGEPSRQRILEIPESGTKGCYVLAVQHTNGYTPIYVGKAAKQTIAKECLTERNTGFFLDYLNEKKKTKPVLFLISQVKGKGKWNEKQIGEVEEYLIANAASKNRELLNKKLLPKENWRIKGMVNSRKGESTNASYALKKTLNIK